MAKITLSTISAGFGAESAMNVNMDSIESEFQNKVLYRNNPTGEANTMENNLDMNGYNILNLGNSTVLASSTVTQAIMWGTQYDGTGSHSLSTGMVFRYTEISASSSVTAVAVIDTEANAGWASGSWIGLIQKGSGKIRVNAGAGVTLRTPETQRSNKQNSAIRVIYRGSDVWYLMGDLETTA